MRLVLLLLLASLVQAGVQNVDCRNPQIFPGAAVNTLILPYQYFGEHNTLERSEAARKLGLLLQRSLMRALLPYGSVGTVQMIKPKAAGASCDAARIADQIAPKLQQGHGAVLLWGTLYEERDELYLRSFARIVRQGPAGDEVKMPVAGLTFSGPMPAQSVAFPPVRLTRRDLQQIERSVRESSQVRQEPSLSSSGTEIPFHPDFPFGYYVTESRGEWMRILPIQDGPSGWMLTGGPADELRARMPEVDYVIAAAGYVRAMAPPGGVRPETAATLARTALDRYLASVHKAEEGAEALAAGLALDARLRLLASRDADSWRGAIASLTKALDADPSDAGARNFLAMCRAWAVQNQAGEFTPSQVVADFKEAAARTSDPRILRNLVTLYEAVLGPDTSTGGVPARPSSPLAANPRWAPLRTSAAQQELQQVKAILGNQP